MLAINDTKGPGSIPDEALAYFKAKKLRIGMDYRDVWGKEHNFAFTVAKMATLDLLQWTKDEVAASLENGTPFEEFRASLEPKLTQAGWLGDGAEKPSRLNLIYDTNVRQARSAGQWERIERTKEAIPYLLYTLGPSQKHREEHVAWAGTLLPVDDPFWDTHMPSNGHNCKCHVIQVTQYRADKLGGVTERPDTSLVEHLDKKTGEVRYAPKGIDPGFDYNPGKSRRQALDKLLDEKE